MKRVKGFTLVELLVVIAIIGVLMSLLMPSLSAAKTEARSVQCKSRMRGFNQMITMHSLDLKYFPVNTTWGTGTPWSLTSGSTTDAFDGDYATMISTYVPTGYNQTWNSRWQKNMFLCPGVDYDPGAAANAAHIYPQAHISSWRVMNYMISGFFGYGNLPLQTKPWWPKKTSTPSLKPTLVLMGEIYSASPGMGYLGSGNRISPHNGATNTLLLGGSVIGIKSPQWTLNNASNGFFYY